MTIPLAEGGAFAVGLAAGHGEAPRRVRWTMGLAARGFTGLPERIGVAPVLDRDPNGELPEFDVLRLLEQNPEPLEMSLGGAAEQPYLNLFAAEGGTGLGPFQRQQAEESAVGTAFPAVFDVNLADAGVATVYRFELNAETRVALSSEGGIDT